MGSQRGNEARYFGERRERLPGVTVPLLSAFARRFVDGELAGGSSAVSGGPLTRRAVLFRMSAVSLLGAGSRPSGSSIGAPAVSLGGHASVSGAASPGARLRGCVGSIGADVEGAGGGTLRDVVVSPSFNGRCSYEARFESRCRPHHGSYRTDRGMR
jgi:hypothetical protein